jgi:hypothetical protein
MGNWDTFFENEDDFFTAISPLIPSGKLIFEDRNKGYAYLSAIDGDLGALAVLKDNDRNWQMVDCYPVPVKSVDNELEILSVEPLPGDDGVAHEAIVTAINKDGTEVNFSVLQFLKAHTEISKHRRFHFGLSAIAGVLSRAPESVSVSEGMFFESVKKQKIQDDPNFDPATFQSVEVGVGNIRFLLDRENGMFEFMSTIEDLEPFTTLGAHGVIMTLNFIPQGKMPLRACIYATNKVLGDYKPRKGDLINGIGWMQGAIGDAVEVDIPWADTAGPLTNEDEEDLRLMTSLSFVESTSTLPIAIRLVGAAFASGGWSINTLERATFRDYAPFFYATKDDRKLWIFVREGIEGFCDPPAWRADNTMQRVEKEAVSRGIEIVRVTITLTPSGKKHFEVKADGLGSLDKEVRLMLGVTRPEFSSPINLDSDPEDDAETVEVLNEEETAKVFVRCMGNHDLEEFSGMMVEDAELTSDLTKMLVKGRLSILIYLGTKLDLWKIQKVGMSFKVGVAVIGGKSRPCSLMYQEGREKPTNCTVFEGRGTLVARLVAYDPASLEYYEDVDP